MKAQECARALGEEIAKVFIGKKEQIRLITTAVFAGGHVLLDDLPGSGKTTLIKALARALGCEARRVQFTPDLLPSDIIGMSVYDRKSSEFRRIKGPVFTNILLADEINRALPRTQSALLEAMEERQVTIDNESFPLPEPFFVMAAQLDRFFVRLSLGFPDRDEERQMLTELGGEPDYSAINVVSGPEQLMELRHEIQEVHVSDTVSAYIVELVHRTREHKLLRSGASPRASRCLYQGGKAHAAICGRDYVTPEDISALFLPVLGHRVTLTNEARTTGKAAPDILESILCDTPVPPQRGEMFNEAARK